MSSPSLNHIEEKKTILVGKIYADWCGHCRDLKPKWKQLKKFIASKMKSIPNLHIDFMKVNGDDKAKMDKLKAKYPKLTVDGYPTIFKHNKEKNEIEKYNGAHEIEDMMKWIMEEKSHSTNDLPIKSGKSKKNRTRHRRNKTQKMFKRKSSKSFFRFW